jgi:hypothetical protein
MIASPAGRPILAAKAMDHRGKPILIGEAGEQPAECRRGRGEHGQVLRCEPRLAVLAGLEAGSRLGKVTAGDFQAHVVTRPREAGDFIGPAKVVDGGDAQSVEGRQVAVGKVVQRV